MKRLLFLLPFFVMGKSAVHTEYNYGRTLLSGWRYYISTLHSGKQECLYRHATNTDTLTRQAALVFSGNNGLAFSNFHATINHTRSILKCDSGYYCMSDESGSYWEIDVDENALYLDINLITEQIVPVYPPQCHHGRHCKYIFRS